MPTTRFRSVAVLMVLVGLAMAFAACGDDGGDSDSAAADEGAVEDGSADTDATATEAEPYPVTIEHQFGSVEIPSEPERIVSLGYQEHDALYALGADPVAVRYWFGDENDVIYPWAEKAAGGADPEILNMTHGELNFEAIAALEPDLIMGVYAGITEDEYEKLAAIAPTLTQPSGYVDFGVPWQVATEVAGQALGKPDEAEALIDDLEEMFAEVATAHPEWAGKEIAVTTYRVDRMGVFGSQDLRSRFFTSLGFEVPTAIDDAAGDQFWADLGIEQAGMIDNDLIVWDQMAYVDGGRQTIRNDRIISNLGAMVDGRAIYLEGMTEMAFAFNSVLSLPYVLDEIVVPIEAALDGDPATTVP